MTYVIWGIVAILVLLILMKLPGTAKLLLSPMKPTSERRRNKERRQQSVPVRVDRRRHPRRLDDLAGYYADRMARKQQLEDSKSP
jgi:hypothetical protein